MVLQVFGGVGAARVVTALIIWLRPYFYKLYMVDIGILSCMTRLRQDVLLDGNDLFKEFRGALTEQFVCQQLKTIRGIEV